MKIVAISLLTLLVVGCGSRDEVYYKAHADEARTKFDSCKLDLQAAALARQESSVRNILSDEECNSAQAALKSNSAEESKNKYAAETAKAEEERKQRIELARAEAEEKKKREAAAKAEEAAEIKKLKLLSESEFRARKEKVTTAMDFEGARLILAAEKEISNELEVAFKSDPLKAQRAFEECEGARAGQSIREAQEISLTVKCQVADRAHSEAQRAQRTEGAKKEAEASEMKVKELLALSVQEFDAAMLDATKKYSIHEKSDAMRRRVETNVFGLKGNKEKVREMMNDCIARKAKVRGKEKYDEAELIEKSLKCRVALKGYRELFGGYVDRLPKEPV